MCCWYLNEHLVITGWTLMTKEATKVFRLYQLLNIRHFISTLLLLCLNVALGGHSNGFLANPGDTNEVISEIQQVRELIQSWRNRFVLHAVVRQPWRLDKVTLVTILESFLSPGRTLRWLVRDLAHIWLPCIQQKRKKSCLIMSSARETIWWTCRAVTWIGGHDFLQECNWMWITDEIFNFTN